MLKSALHWGCFAAALFVVGPLAWMLVAPLRGIDGVAATTPILSDNPVVGLVRGVLAVGLAVGMGLASAKFVGRTHGYFNAGMVLAWAAAGTATIDGLIRNHAVGELNLLAVEGLLFGGLVLACVWGVHRLTPEKPADPTSPPARELRSAPLDMALITGLTLAAGLLASWLVAQNTLKGQMIATGAATTLVAAALAPLVVPRFSMLALIAGVVLITTIAIPATMLYHGSAVVAKATYGGALLSLGRPLPLDWLAGALLGLPTGLSLGAWMTEHRHKPAAQPA